MGILDTILGFFQTTKKDTRSADNAVKKAKSVGQSGSYNQASIQSFYALEKIGEEYGEQKREVHVTAREYASMMAESGLTSSEELEPLILNFEVAKYSEGEISSGDYSNADEVLSVVHKRYKSGRPSKGSATDKKKATKSRKRSPKRGGATGAARTRKAKPRKKRTKK